MTQLTENLTVWQLWYFKAVTSYRGKPFQVPTRQTGEYKVDLTRHPKFPLDIGELASGRFPHRDKQKRNKPLRLSMCSQRVKFILHS